MSHITDDITHDVSSTPQLNADDRHKLLETERRRLALTVLAGKSGPVSVYEVALDILELKEGADPDEDAIDRITSMLHHIDIPVMASANVLDYDSTSRRINPHSIPAERTRPHIR